MEEGLERGFGGGESGGVGGAGDVTARLKIAWRDEGLAGGEELLPAPLSCCMVEHRHDDDSEEEEVPSYSFAKALQTAQQAFLLPDSTQPEVEWVEGAEQGAEETEVCGRPPHCPATDSLERQPSPSRL